MLLYAFILCQMCFHYNFAVIGVKNDFGGVNFKTAEDGDFITNLVRLMPTNFVKHERRDDTRCHNMLLGFVYNILLREQTDKRTMDAIYGINVVIHILYTHTHTHSYSLNCIYI